LMPTITTSNTQLPNGLDFSKNTYLPLHRNTATLSINRCPVVPFCFDLFCSAAAMHTKHEKHGCNGVVQIEALSQGQTTSAFGIFGRCWQFVEQQLRLPLPQATLYHDVNQSDFA